MQIRLKSLPPIILVFFLGRALAHAQEITEFDLPPGGSPRVITAGPDGNLWFTEALGDNYLNGTIGHITPGGVVIYIPQPLYPQPKSIATGPDGNLWFPQDDSCDNGFASVGRMTPAGVLTEFPQPNCRYFGDIAVGSDGNLWFTWTDQSVPFVFIHGVSRITPAGVTTHFSVPRALGIAAGPDGAIWFTEGGSNFSPEGGLDRIGRITTTGAISEFALPAGSAPTRIVAGPDGNLWFTEASANKIGRITPLGTVTEFSVPTGGSRPTYITSGRDGNLWFTEQQGNKIGRITTAGAVTEFLIPTANASPRGIVAGADGNIWFTEANAGKIGKLSVPGTCSVGTANLCLSSGRFNVEIEWRVPSQGTSGSGTPIALTGDAGYFWFFSPNNVELVIKVIDGRAFNNKFWVFYGALSNVEYTITVTDTKTGTAKTYFNPSGTFASVADTTTFNP